MTMTAVRIRCLPRCSNRGTLLEARILTSFFYSRIIQFPGLLRFEESSLIIWQAGADQLTFNSFMVREDSC